MTQSIHRAHSSFSPNFHLAASQPIGIQSKSSEIKSSQTKNIIPSIKFQNLNVTDDFTNEFVNETDNSVNKSSDIKNYVQNKPTKPNKDSANFDEICEIDQIAILPFFPISFKH